MPDPVDSLILDLLAFIAAQDRTYDEVMEAWRTSCPRLPVWEEANSRGFVARVRRNGIAAIRVTAAGNAFLLALQDRTRIDVQAYTQPGTQITLTREAPTPRNRDSGRSFRR